MRNVSYWKKYKFLSASVPSSELRNGIQCYSITLLNCSYIITIYDCVFPHGQIQVEYIVF